MKAEFRGWYMDLLIYQYDHGSIPNDMDELAGICRVRPSEYELFKQVHKQVLEQKFKQDDNQRWTNEFASEILRKREKFTDKRKKSGNIGVIIKLAKSIKGFNNKHVQRLKDELYSMESEEIEKHKHKQVLEQKLKLYINVDEDVDVNKDISIRIDSFKNKVLENLEKYDSVMLNDFFEYWTESNEGSNVLRFEMRKNQPFDIKRRLVTWKKNDKGFKPASKSPHHNVVKDGDYGVL